MAKYLIDSETLTDIADAIREQTGESGNIQVSQMASQISSISGGSHTYSTTEHEVGTWIDGSTIYEITIDVAQYNITANNSQWQNMYAVANIKDMISIEVHKECPNVGQFLIFRGDSGYIQVSSNTSVNLTVFAQYYGTFPVTFRYTKQSAS